MTFFLIFFFTNPAYPFIIFPKAYFLTTSMEMPGTSSILLILLVVAFINTATFELVLAEAMHVTVHPLSCVYLTTLENVGSLSVHLPMMPLSIIRRITARTLEYTFTMLLSIYKLSFIAFTSLGDEDALTMAQIIEHLANVWVSVIELARLILQFPFFLFILAFILLFLYILSFIDIILNVVYLWDCPH